MWNQEQHGGTATRVGLADEPRQTRRVSARHSLKASDLINYAFASFSGRGRAITRMRRIVAGSITKSSYLTLLHQMHPLHLLVEQAARAVDPENGMFRTEEMCRADLIAADIESLSGTSRGVLPETRDLLAKLEDEFQRRPASAMGAVYAIETSRLGSVTLARAVSRALGLPPKSGRGLDYLLHGMGTVQGRLENLQSDLDRWCTSLAVHREVVTGARLTAEGIAAILCAATTPEARGATRAKQQ